MAPDNGPKPFLSQVCPTSDSESLEHHSSGSFATLPSGGSIDSGMRSSGTARVGSTNPKNNTTALSEGVPRNNEQQGDDMITPPKTKRPRGRPPGSKNKPKPPVVIVKESECSMTPALIEITPGSDVVKALVAFARCRGVGISVQCGSGPVSDVMLHDPFGCVPPFSIRGPLHMMSLTGTYYDDDRFAPPPSPPCSSSFSILLSSSQGQILGGVVGGRVLAAGIVLVTAFLFKKPDFRRLHFVDGDGGEGGGNDDDDDAPFVGAINMINAINANAAGSGTGDSGGAIINKNVSNNNAANSSTVAAFNSIHNNSMSANYAAVGSTSLNNCQITPDGDDDFDVKNVNVMQRNHVPHHHPTI